MNERQIILEALLLIEKGEDYGERIIKDVLDKYAYLDRQHRSFMKRVMEGCLEKKIELDYIIDRFSKTPTDRMKPVILSILRMGVYQMKYMETPQFAACSEAVKLAQKKGFANLKGFVNGVLRTIAKNIKDIPYPDPEKDPILHDSIVYSLPPFLVEHFRTNYPESADQIMEALNREALLCVRINRARTDEESLVKKLAGQAELTKLEPVSGLDRQETAYSLKGFDRLTDLKAFTDGDLIVQDQASMQAVAQLDLKDGDTVLDVCAAPGGKSMQAAERLCKLNSGKITACDISERKVELIRENAARCGFTQIEAVVCDATVRSENYVNYADVLIADLPCSGLGTIARKADIKYRMNASEMEKLVQLQRQILTNVTDYVKAGGTLLYSTCTINPKENEKQAEWIGQNLPFTLVKMHQIFPSGSHDGFFFAIFEKR